MGQGHQDRAEPFSLLFEGPKELPLEQGIHDLECGCLGTLGIFIVPVGLSANGRLYGAPPWCWAMCLGKILSIFQSKALFSLLGTNFRGDGRTTFGLPQPAGPRAVRDRA